MKYIDTPVNDDGWTDWFMPHMEGWRTQCCDCGLVHEWEFRIKQGRVSLRVKRHVRATAAVRRNK